MHQSLFATILGVALTASVCLAIPASADDAQVARGRFLVTIAGCSDCHTPGALLGSPDMKRYLGGSDVGFAIPGAGVFVGENLTPDKETGLGSWTDEQIIAAIRTGKTPEGRELSAVMPTSTTRCQRRRSRVERDGSSARQRHFGRKSRPTPLLTNWSV
jgi:mono/diheme cytochrome c family protein